MEMGDLEKPIAIVSGALYLGLDLVPRLSHQSVAGSRRYVGPICFLVCIFAILIWMFRPDKGSPHWYLKLDRIEYEKDSTNAPAICPGFRILATVNGEDCSFPVGQMLYGGLKTELEPRDSAGVSIYRGQLNTVEFKMVAYRDIGDLAMGMIVNTNMGVMAGTMMRTNIDQTPASTSDFYNLSELPAKRRNSVLIFIPNSDEPVGRLFIDYEITTNFVNYAPI